MPSRAGVGSAGEISTSEPRCSGACGRRLFADHRAPPGSVVDNEASIRAKAERIGLEGFNEQNPDLRIDRLSCVTTGVTEISRAYNCLGEGGPGAREYSGPIGITVTCDQMNCIWEVRE